MPGFAQRSARRLRRLPALAAALALGSAVASCGQGSAPAPAAPATAPAAAAASPPPPAQPAADPAEPRALPPGAAPDGRPQLEFASLRHEFGKISDAGKYIAEFPFKNSGTAPLVIGTVKTDCACTTAQMEQTEFLPGEASSIRVEFNPLKPGPQERQVRVFSNSLPSMTILYIVADVETLIQFKGPMVVNFGTLKLGVEHKRNFTVDYKFRDLAFEDFASNSPHVRARLVSAGTPVPDVGYRATIEVTILPTAPWGLLYAVNLSFTARRPGAAGTVPLEKVYTVFVSAELFNDLRGRAEMYASRDSSPGAVFNTGESIGEGKDYSARLVLERLSGAPFAILGAVVERSSIPGMSVSFEALTPSSYRFTLSGNTKGSFGAFDGLVRVTTDVPGEEDLAIPFNGYIK